MIPDYISVLGKRWPLVEIDGLREFGVCYYDEFRIELRKGMAHEHLGDTILHEALHVISAELDLDVKERQVRNIATALVQVLRANPALVALIVEGA